MNKKIVLLFAFLALSYVAVSLLDFGKKDLGIAHVDLTGISNELDGWVGEDVEIRDETLKVLNAQSFINRSYRDPSGSTVMLHVANWENQNTIFAAPHPPNVCFPSAGWTLLARKTSEFPSAKGIVPIELMLFRKNQQYVVTGHWFRTGHVTYVDNSGFQAQRRRFWGTKAWPDTTKFMLQVASSSLEAAEEPIKSFASMVEDRLEPVAGEAKNRT